jgi:N-acetylglucosamine-6-phosphate deacetylase
MSIKIIANDYKTEKLMEFIIQADRVISVQCLSDSADHSYPWICPGFIDVHINGFGGFDLNSTTPNKHTVIQMINALAVHGVTSCVPTIITTSFEHMADCIIAIRQACEEDPIVDKSIVGIHLEGPYLSPEQGFKGAHPAHEMRNPDWSEFMEWQRLSGNRIKKVTLALELPGSIAFISQLKEHGVIAAVGHSNASSLDIQHAIEAGLTMCTHLGNGVHHMLPRHAPCVWDLLASTELYAGFIADGHHLPRSVVDVIIQMKGKKAILVSDAVHLAGMEPGKYDTHIGGAVQLLANGRLHLADNPNVLAGSAVSLLDSMQNLLSQHPDQWIEMIDLATENPADLFGLTDKGRISVDGLADFILYRKNDSSDGMIIQDIWQQGVRIQR